jgi:hypothetical protein
MAVVVNNVPRDANDVWQAARWAFAWLLGRAIEASPDVSVRAVFQSAIVLDGLHLHHLETPLAERVRKILLEVAKRGASGELPDVEVEGRILDKDSQAQFRAAMPELVRLLSQ